MAITPFILPEPSALLCEADIIAQINRVQTLGSAILHWTMVSKPLAERGDFSDSPCRDAAKLKMIADMMEALHVQLSQLPQGPTNENGVI